MRTIFPVEDVQALFDVTGSWDMVLATAGYAAINGVSKLSQARHLMLKENRGVPVHKLLQVYGVI